ncbi:MAG: hypothetical protein Q4G03_06330 [Planctomycetia bacterium]|nr:hypothetical protein [Planctomycetia bacterium]
MFEKSLTPTSALLLRLSIRFVVALLCLANWSGVTFCLAQSAVSNIASSPAGATWRDSNTGDTTQSQGNRSASSSTDATGATTEEGFVGPRTTRYSLELTKLPDSQGQFWVVYDIAPYCERFPNVSEPQRSILDWILLDSGEEFWHKDPFCVLSATRERLYVYHTEKVQQYVANIVDRFLDVDKRATSFAIKVVVLQSPEWRMRVSQYLSTTHTTVVGNGADVQSWLLDQGDMAKVQSDLQRRSDYVLLNSVNNVVPNGETFGWAAAAPRRAYTRDYLLDSSVAAGYVSDVASVDQGFRIETTPLLSTTGEVLETSFRYRCTVVEKWRALAMRVPTPAAPRQQLNVEKPSIVSCDFRGKISIPQGKCAIIDLGMVPMVLPKKETESNGIMDSVTNLTAKKGVYYDVLILIEPVE